MSGNLTAWFPDKLTTQAGVSGVASSKAITASTPILLPCRVQTHTGHKVRVTMREKKEQKSFTSSKIITKILSKAEGVPPLCTCPRTVVRVSKPSLSVTSWKGKKLVWTRVCVQFNIFDEEKNVTFLIWSEVMGLPSLEMAPSATMMTFKREPRLLCYKSPKGNQFTIFDHL